MKHAWCERFRSRSAYETVPAPALPEIVENVPLQASRRCRAGRRGRTAAGEEERRQRGRRDAELEPLATATVAANRGMRDFDHGRAGAVPV